MVDEFDEGVLQWKVRSCDFDDRRFHYLSKLVSERKLKLEYCQREYQVDDLLTKWVTIEASKRLKKHISMEDLKKYFCRLIHSTLKSHIQTYDKKFSLII